MAKRLDQKLNKIFLSAIIATIALAFMTSLFLGSVRQKQALNEVLLHLETLMDSQMSLLTQDLVNDRFYAAAVRGRAIISENQVERLEIGLYRDDGTPLFESPLIAQLKKQEAVHLDGSNGKLVSLKKTDYVLVRRPIVFAGSTIGHIEFGQSVDFRSQRNLANVLFAALLGLAASLAALLLTMRAVLRRSILGPIHRLQAAIPRIGSFLNGSSPQLNLPADLGPEINEVVRTLTDVTTKLKVALEDQKTVQLRKGRDSAMIEIAQQVSHDIRSPLAALAVVEKDLKELPEEKRILIRSAVGRIRDIANSLLAKERSLSIENTDSSGSEGPSPQLISLILEQLITEKRLQFRLRAGLEIEGHFDAVSYGLFAKVQPVEFKRAISNLINNAVEAIEGDRGFVHVYLGDTGSEIVLEVRDNGCGIPANVLPTLAQRGASHAKDSGLGLGLYHARSCIESWGGHLTLSSELSQGTSVSIRLPKAEVPEWFGANVNLGNSSQIVILDDDTSIHEIWQDRFHKGHRSSDRELLHFFTPDEIKKWLRAQPHFLSDALFLIDYELAGFTETGLDIIESHNLQKRSLLVTSRFEEKQIRDRCQKLGVKVIPKTMAGFVQFSESASARVTNSH